MVVHGHSTKQTIVDVPQIYHLYYVMNIYIDFEASTFCLNLY